MTGLWILAIASAITAFISGLAMISYVKSRKGKSEKVHIWFMPILTLLEYYKIKKGEGRSYGFLGVVYPFSMAILIACAFYWIFLTGEF